MLRAQEPHAVQKRLKLFMYSDAGVGKTTCAVQFPSAYIIDCEKGTEWYADLIRNAGSRVFQARSLDDVVVEVKSLASEQHDYRTLIIDPITVVYDDLLDAKAKAVGTQHGKHYGETNKVMKQLMALIRALDMNVVMTAHEKKEYGDNMKVLGETFDGWKKLSYTFDVVVQLARRDKVRWARAVKSRVPTFPEQEWFEWSYNAIRDRFDHAMLDNAAAPVRWATPQQVAEINWLLQRVRLPPNTVNSWFAKACVDRFDQMAERDLAKCIDYVKQRLVP